MRLGTRVTATVTGLVEFSPDDDTLYVRDEVTGKIARVPNDGSVQKLNPAGWPPVEGDVWKHLGVTFLTEQRGDSVWMIASNEEGSMDPEEVLRMRPGITLVNRAPDNIYSERGYQSGDPVKPVKETNVLPG